MEHGQEAHTQSACHAYGHGAYQHLPFKGCIRDDLSVPNRVENSEKWQHCQPFYPRTEGRIRTVRSRADSGMYENTLSVVPSSGILLTPICFGCGKRRVELAWSVSVQLRDMPRYYRLRTVLPRHLRNGLAARCPCRSQARTIPFVDTVLFHFKNFCLWHMKKILPSSNPNRKSLL